MANRILRVAAAAALLALPGVARAQMIISFAGGPSVPIGALGDVTDIGYNIAAGVSLGGTSVPVTLRFEAAYNAFGGKGSGSDRNVPNLTANAIFNITQTKDAPYLIAGIGGYRDEISNRVGSTNFTSSRNAAGINVGGGLRFPLSGLSTFFEARFHYVFAPEGGTSIQFVPVTFGVAF